MMSNGAMPILIGEPIRVTVSRSLGDNLGASSIPNRVIYLDGEVLREHGEFERILVHEIFHFVWVRLSNQTRWDWERVLREEKGRGELGWSAEWRKTKLTATDRKLRSTAWRIYACESFCDSAAWMYAALKDHDEFTLGVRESSRRRLWFDHNFATRRIAV
jgi:hypothetical protein